MPVMSGDDHRADEHLASRHAIVTVDHPEIGPERHIDNPIRFARIPRTPAGRAPLLSEHTHDVLTRWLHLEPAALAAALADGTCR
jgi:crotonobetainyl-CoA:carnitine CoA-transferase CaiB-like acyl-CoA transferase